MNFDEYQKQSRETAIYPNQGKNFIYPTLGLVGEAGEIAEKIKKVLRAGKDGLSEEEKGELSKEMGDVLWYMAQLSTEFGLSLGDIAKQNIEKLQSRKQRGVLHGNGDNR